MKRKITIGIVSMFGFFLCSMLVAPFSSGQQDTTSEGSIQSVTGTVAEVDWASSTLIVHTHDYGSGDQLTFFVPDDAVLTRGSGTIGFAEINQGDEVEIQYLNTLSGFRVVRLDDKNMAETMQ